MPIENDLESIREAIKAGRFSNEAAVSQGIVLRLLAALDWPAYDTDVVCPEFSLSGRRVDFALCAPARKPVAFIEVKQIGQTDGAERQLFEYAFHAGIPLAILTDGQAWSFFLPAEQGDYGERRVYKLDLLERDVKECADRLRRYLSYASITNGEAIQNARDDYRSISRTRQIERSLPEAWERLVTDEDEMLLQLLADKVESICGFKPEPDAAAQFLREFLSRKLPVQPLPVMRVDQAHATVSQQRRATPQVALISTGQSNQGYGRGFYLEGAFTPAKNAINTLKLTLEAFQARDSSFCERFASLPQHGRNRRYLDRNRENLYPGRPDLCEEYSISMVGIWWISTNHSKQTIKNIIEMACRVANISFGSTYKLYIDD